MEKDGCQFMNKTLEIVPTNKVDGQASFIFTPRNTDALTQPIPLEKMQPYRIVDRIVLNRLDFENFATDMLVEREYLEPFEDLCHTGPVYECVLVCRQGNKREGILVIPDSGGYIKCAARYDDQESDNGEI